MKSIPRWLAAKALGRAWSGAATSRLAPVELAEVDPPELPGPRWARVRPILSGICGSDLSTLAADGSPYFSPLVSTPFVFGHEVVGEVEAVGPEVTAVAVGDRVALSPPLHCAIRGIDLLCPECAAGETGHCRNVTRGELAPGIQTGYCRDTGGGWSRALVAHELQLHRVPDGLSDQTAVLIEPFACCLHAVERAGLEDSDTALVLGAGTIGLLTVAAIRASGSKCRVVAVAKYPLQADAARRLGADEVVRSGGAMRDELAAHLDVELHSPEIGPPTGIGGADVTFDCVASAATLDDAMRFTRARGAVIVVGMPGVPGGVDWTAMWHKELDVRGSYTAGEATFARAVGLAAERDALLRPLVGAVYPLEEWRDAVRAAMDSGSRGLTKVAFRP
ncbi:MAG TPA: alcohol dehydrogenase catalytic domain-containing protein [Gemmatimonadota bacterium]|nr:alcohol dehydrogenase catalytic domain-containing protein [Gemmatimonadota bacterium]